MLPWPWRGTLLIFPPGPGTALIEQSARRNPACRQREHLAARMQTHRCLHQCVRTRMHRRAREDSSSAPDSHLLRAGAIPGAIALGQLCSPASMARMGAWSTQSPRKNAVFRRFPRREEGRAGAGEEAVPHWNFPAAPPPQKAPAPPPADGLCCRLALAWHAVRRSDVRAAAGAAQEPCLCGDALSHVGCHLPPSLFN